jgi:uncharacterized protein YdbL (DUF1318 family)
MRLHAIALGLVLTVMTIFPAFALDLKEARATGHVGETTKGYVAVIKTSPEVEELAATINAKRKQEYARISQENGQSVDVVAKVAAEQIINNLDEGSLYQAVDGSWRRR